MSATSKTYTLIFILIYTTVVIAAVFVYQLPFADILITFLYVGIGFSFIAWRLTQNIQPGLTDKPPFKNEGLVLILVTGWIVLYITYGGTFINNLLPKNILENEQVQFFIVIARKLIVFVIVPYLVYRAFGFSLKDFGLKVSLQHIFTKKNMLVFIALSACILLFQYYFSNGAKPLRTGQFSGMQLLPAVLLTFLWLFIEVGLVEEFFFRAVLQSRLAGLLRSQWGAILVGGLVFGLAHAPGLYLRGAESEGISEQLPFGFWLSYCIVNMSIAGIFIAITWSKTKNLYLVMALHAMVDLIPNIDAFIHTWKI
jgi:membrane protease YdiL (CAAX protease family)